MAPPKGRRMRRHGLVSLRNALRGGMVDPHSQLGQALAAMRAALASDLGASTPDALSEGQRIMLDTVVRAKLRADAIGAYLDQLKSLDELRDPIVLGLVREGRNLDTALAARLLDLRDPRLTRQAAPKSWDDQLAAAMAELEHDQEPPQDADESHVEAPGDELVPEVAPGHSPDGHKEAGQ